MRETIDRLENCNHYTPARRNSTRTTVRYFIGDCPYCMIEHQQTQLRTLAEELLYAHQNICAGSGTISGGSVGCLCSACRLAREIMEEENE